MKTPYANPQEDDLLKKAIGYSVAFHLVLLAAFAVRVAFFPSEPLEIETAIRVDMVALPDKGRAKLPPAVEPAPAPAPKKVAEEPAPPPKPVEAPKPPPPVEAPKPVQIAKPETKVEPKPDSPKVNLDKAKKDQEAALKRLEAMQKLEKMMKADKQPPQQASASTSVATEKNTQSQGAPVKGNEISKGSSLTGVARLDHQNYVATVTDHVKRHWNLPGWLATANLRTVIRVFIDANGYVVKKQIIQSSNNEAFDDRVMAAIESSMPFPAPPDNLVNVLAVSGMRLDLTPGD